MLIAAHVASTWEPLGVENAAWNFVSTWSAQHDVLGFHNWQKLLMNLLVCFGVTKSPELSRMWSFLVFALPLIMSGGGSEVGRSPHLTVTWELLQEPFLPRAHSQLGGEVFKYRQKGVLDGGRECDVMESVRGKAIHTGDGRLLERPLSTAPENGELSRSFLPLSPVLRVLRTSLMSPPPPEHHREDNGGF